jgi:hypothetical protein
MAEHNEEKEEGDDAWMFTYLGPELEEMLGGSVDKSVLFLYEDHIAWYIYDDRVSY